jgi:type I restriction enzyme, R subunit
MFDLLTKPEIRLTRKQEIEAKKIARKLLDKLKAELLVLDWRKRQRTQAAVRLCIKGVLDALPEAYTDEQYERKCEVAYQHIYESYFGAGRSVYAAA